MVGGKPEKFSALADMTKMPAERQGTCQGDYSNASWSWNTLLKPHIRSPEQPKTPVPVTYADPGPYLQLQRGIQQIRILETIADHLSDRFVWRRPIGLEIRACGAPGAHWDLPLSKIIICYELAADFGDLYRGYATERAARSN
jgi:hypothetical protein